MKKQYLSIVLTSVLWVPITSMADATVEPAGMKIVWNPLKKEFDGFQTYNSAQGAYVTLGVSVGDKGIIGFNKDSSKITISDGTNDLEGKFGMWNKISKDGKTMRVEVASEKLPAGGTTVLDLTGKLDITVASKKETKATAARAFKKGDKVELTDDFKFVIEKIGKPKWGKDPLSVTLKWKKKIPELAAVRFVSADGKKIESSTGSSWSSGMLGSYSVAKSYTLKQQADSFKIEVDLWSDAETITIPVKLAVGLAGSK